MGRWRFGDGFAGQQPQQQNRKIAADAVGQVGELRLFLMAALLTADEAADQRYRIEQLEAELERLRNARAEVEAVAARAIASTAARIEDLTQRREG